MSTAANDPVPDCPGPLYPDKPTLALPAGSCDTHVHVVGPYDRYPLVDKRMYTPPPSTVEDLRRYLDESGIDRTTIVHVTVAGETPDITLDAIAELGQDRARGVVMPGEGVSDTEIQRWHAAGIRGARVTGFGNDPLTERKLRTIAEKIAPYGWHLVYMNLGEEEWNTLSPILLDLPVEVVVDHMGCRLYNFDGDIDQPAFQSLLGAVAEGRMWAKVSGYYRYSSDPEYPWPQSVKFAQALLDANPDRLLWASDWPFPVLRDKPMHATSSIIDWWSQLQVSDSDIKKVLVDNPANLYEFPATPGAD